MHQQVHTEDSGGIFNRNVGGKIFLTQGIKHFQNEHLLSDNPPSGPAKRGPIRL